MMQPVYAKIGGALVGITISTKYQQANGQIGYICHMFASAWQPFITLDMISCTIDESVQIVTGDTPAQTVIISNVMARQEARHKARFDYLIRSAQHYQRYAQAWRDSVKEDGTITQVNVGE